ncbi:MAG: peptide chain release factor N(5)-glutamine methyltransferase [Deltaproteobacteria bacterium]|nr:peptide chain release factor N(5)-glutamine methyltransferase [Deltaproteobacteria bacterium]
MDNQPDSSGNEWTILKLLKWTTSYFKSHKIESPRPGAEILLASILEINRIDLYLRYDQPLNRDELDKFKALIKRRVKREPVAYITGVKGFWSLNLAVTKDVLIPRPETECLVEAALSFLPAGFGSDSNFSPKRILDLGTGTGAIILALSSEQSGHLFFASDCSVKAIKVAKENAKRNNLNETVCFFVGDWFSPINDKKAFFDIIISNPPYIQTGALCSLQPEIYEYEPGIALDGDEDGLSSLRRIISSAHIYLNRQGNLFLEIGHDQKDAVGKIIDDSKRYDDVVFSKDYSGNDRVVRMRKK